MCKRFLMVLLCVSLAFFMISCGVSKKLYMQKEDEVSDCKARIENLQAKTTTLETEKKVEEDQFRETRRAYREAIKLMATEIAADQLILGELADELTLAVLDNELFDPGMSTLKPAGQKALKKIADFLKGRNDLKTIVAGHTDNAKIHGDLAKEYKTNWELSAARAANVTEYFEKQGVNPVSLIIMAYGQYKPVAGNETAAGRAKNRRIEIVVTKKDKPLLLRR